MSERKEKFTPGPWKKEGAQAHYVRSANGTICDCRYKNGVNDSALIAAAPDMYAALEKAIADYGKPGGPWNVPSEPGTWIHSARAALAKARGEL